LLFIPRSARGHRQRETVEEQSYPEAVLLLRKMPVVSSDIKSDKNEEEMMNVYEKLAEARVEFMKTGAKMSGKNTFAGYTYFELSDILPVINRLSVSIGFICEVSFDDNIARLVFRNTEKPDEKITFSSPMSTASLKGCHEVQNLGAVETYIKRYLYQNCFEIVESDALNMTHGKTDPVKKSEPVQVTTKAPAVDWSARAAALTAEAGITPERKAQIWADCGKTPEKYCAYIEKLMAAQVDAEAAAPVQGEIF